MKYYRQESYSEPRKYFYNVESFSEIDGRSDEETLPLNAVAYAYNIRLRAGHICAGQGVARAKVGEKLVPSTLTLGFYIKNLFLYRRYDGTLAAQDDRLIAVGHNNRIYQFPLTGTDGFSDLGIVPIGTVSFLNVTYQNADALLILTEGGTNYIYDGTQITSLTGQTAVHSVTEYNNRYYGLNAEDRLVSSASATDWSQNGVSSVAVPEEGGRIRKTVALRDSLYIFKEYAVFRLTTYSNTGVSAMTEIYSTSGKIVADTIAEGFASVVFMTEDGFFRLDSDGTVDKIWKNIFGLLTETDGCVGSFYRNKYYLSCAMKREGTGVGEETNCVTNNAVFCLDEGDTDCAVLRGADVAQFLPVCIDGETYLLLRFTVGYRSYDVGMMTEDGKLFGNVLSKYWRTANSCFGYLKEKKLLRKIHVKPHGNMTVKVVGDETYTYVIPAGVRHGTVYVNRISDSFSVCFSTEDSGFLVTGMELEFALFENN